MKVTGKRVQGFPLIAVDEQPLDPLPSLKLRNHSPDGFNWGYSGSGPAQFALALMLKAGIPEAVALERYQDFKRDVIARLPDEFSMELIFYPDGSWHANVTQGSTHA